MLDPSFLFDLESNMQVLQEDGYKGLLDSLWWKQITRELPSQKKRERIIFQLATAQIRREGLGGNKRFDELVAESFELDNENAGGGIRIKKNEFDDLDGTGVDQASTYSRDIGRYAAYWPQLIIAQLILYGETGKGYDGLSFFNASHPVNPVDSENAVTYANIFTGGASGSYPGACPIDDSVTLDVAFQNFGKIVGYVRGIKMPNGQDPRGLKVAGIMAPARMTPRVQQLTNAKIIAQAAASGGGSGDVEAIIRSWGMSSPIEVLEFGAGQSYTMPDGTVVTGSDNTFYVYCEEVGSAQVGSMIYVNRQPFTTTFYGNLTVAELGRMNALEYQTEGRNTGGYGHPFRLFKCKAS